MTKAEIMTRAVSVAHGEAFQLMLYRAEDGSEAWFWNSRDGVTPFGTAIEGKHYRHAMHGYPTGYFGVLPDKAEWVWVTHTPATWEAMQRSQDERHRALGGELGEDFRARFPTVDDWLAVTPFEHGQPHQLTRDEYLANTPEWAGRILTGDQ
jgi:hypothetical protein